MRQAYFFVTTSWSVHKAFKQTLVNRLLVKSWVREYCWGLGDILSLLCFSELNLYSKLNGHYIYRQFNVQEFYVLPTQCIYLFCVDLRTNSHYFPIQHSLTGFYNRDLTLCSPVVTICTVSLTFKNSTFCPHTVFMCFVWISEQTAIISLYSIHWLVFITEI